MSLRRLIFILLSITMMTIIFIFSSRNAEMSTDDSLQVGLAVGKLVVEDFEELPHSEKIEFARSIDYYVRKSAHFTEYMLLGFFLMGAFAKPASEKQEKKKNGRMMEMLLSLGTGVLYAVSDEIHQIFVPGRSCQAFDVMIDSSGVLSGAFIMLLILILNDKFFKRLC